MNNLENQILKSTRPGKSDAGENPCIEGCVNPNIQDKYSLNTKTSPLDYSVMLMPLTKNMQDKNKCCPFRNWHSGKI